jgi:hypothetical protein
MFSPVSLPGQTAQSLLRSGQEIDSGGNLDGDDHQNRLLIKRLREEPFLSGRAVITVI